MVLQEQRSQGREQRGLRRALRESGQLFRPLHTKNEAVPGSGNSMCESRGWSM